MYPSLHPDLGKPTAREALSGGFLLPPSGLLRLFGAFCAILAVTLVLEAASPMPDRPTETIAATDILTKEGK